LFLSSLVYADIYLHNPRGSNNRLDDQGRDRNNGNRMFDSQNNNRGGMNVGSVYYLSGSNLNLEWSPQHSCGGPNNHCDLILQYTCDDRLRDGTTTRTIPDQPKQCYNFDCDTDLRFGRHESFDYYTTCKYTSRNKGLFAASQKLKGQDARYTRQNPNGQRRGYECPEERDYYPYWRPTPWRDIAVFTNEESRCAEYVANSENVKGRSYCQVEIQSFATATQKSMKYVPITEEECKTLNYTDAETEEVKFGEWTTHDPHGIPAPKCLLNHWTRDNHHGNTVGALETEEQGQWPGWKWTIPDIDPGMIDPERCTMRLRYNISTGDTDHFDSEEEVTSAALTSGNNTKGNNNQQPSELKLFADREGTIPYFESWEEQVERDYTLRNNPQVDIFGGLLGGDKKVRLQLAVNTAQFGRTFQDRTHRFAIRSVPEDAEYAGKMIYNVQVRGKRGNIVQTYPATEYDFTPNKLHCSEGEYVHFQWTGSNTNPNNNDGQGRQGSDRSNIVPMRAKNYEEPMSAGRVTDGTTPATFGHLGNSYPAVISGEVGTEGSFLGLTEDQLISLALLEHSNGNTQTGQFGGEMSELDDAGTYFDMGPVKCGAQGIFNYVCTRNNNFSNRSQKGRITVTNTARFNSRIGLAGGEIAGPAEGEALIIPAEALLTSHDIQTSYAPPETSHFVWTDQKVRNPVSRVVSVLPIDLQLQDGQHLYQSVTFNTSAYSAFSIWRAESTLGPWERLKNKDHDISFQSGVANFTITQGGYYVVERRVNVGYVFLTIFVLLAFIGGIYYVCKKRNEGSNKSLTDTMTRKQSLNTEQI